MHAYAVKDPSWLAIREVGQSQYINALDGACSPCHSPIGLRSGDIKWGPFDITDLDPVSQEGVGCDACHTITGITRLSNGGFMLAPSDVKHGTIKDPIPNSFHESKYNDLYASSEYCGSCHDFVTNDGSPLEIVFQEWQAVLLSPEKRVMTATWKPTPDRLLWVDRTEHCTVMILSVPILL